MTSLNPDRSFDLGASGSPFIPPPGTVKRARQRAAVHLRSTPEEGWLTVGLLVAMGLAFGWSVDDARWVLGRDNLTDFVPWAVTLGLVWGFVSAKAGWGRWFSHVMGAVFAALIVPLFVGAVLVESGSLHNWYVATAHSVVEAYLDLAWRGRTLTQQYGHFALILGLIGWATGQFAGYAAFGHRRPMTAVVTLGLALLFNMSITIRDQLPYLVIFSLVALFFLIRANAFAEQELVDPAPDRRSAGRGRPVRPGRRGVRHAGRCRVAVPDGDGVIRAARRGMGRHRSGARQLRNPTPALPAGRRPRYADHGHRIRIERTHHRSLGDRIRRLRSRSRFRRTTPTSTTGAR